MARQSTTPIQFNKTRRTDRNIAMTSGRAGKVIPITYFPVLRGDSASGKVGIDVDLAEMPRPLLNSVQLNAQAWFVPKSAHPQFSGQDEFMHSYQGEVIKALGQADRNPPPFFTATDFSPGFHGITKSLGIHWETGRAINTDLIDAYALIQNFRRAAHSSRLTRRPYAAESVAGSALTLDRAFWPTGRFSRVVPDYERALVVGQLDLDVQAGQIPVSGFAVGSNDPTSVAGGGKYSGGVDLSGEQIYSGNSSGGDTWSVRADGVNGLPELLAEMTGQKIGVTLADIDKARERQAFAKLRTQMAGNDPTGFTSDDAIVAELMQGFRVPEDQFKRPWLLDSKRVTFGMVERYATDAANLDASVSQGRASSQLSINLPQTEAGGMVIVVIEVLPERLYERQSDEWMHITDVSELPDALRDVQRTEPVDLVTNARVDARHTDPDGLFGYEAMNDVWNRDTTRLGGAFYQADPANPWTEQRSAIWQVNTVDPSFTEDHWLAPEDFPHYVFSDTTADAFEVVCRHDVTLVGLTQIGDVLSESNDDYAAVVEATEE